MLILGKNPIWRAYFADGLVQPPPKIPFPDGFWLAFPPFVPFLLYGDFIHPIQLWKTHENQWMAIRFKGYSFPIMKTYHIWHFGCCFFAVFCLMIIYWGYPPPNTNEIKICSFFMKGPRKKTFTNSTVSVPGIPPNYILPITLKLPSLKQCVAPRIVCIFRLGQAWCLVERKRGWVTWRIIPGIVSSY